MAAVGALVAQMADGEAKARLEAALRGEETAPAKPRQEVLSGAEVAEVLNCSRRHVQHLAARGILKRVVMPGSSRGCGYSRKCVEALVGVGA